MRPGLSKKSTKIIQTVLFVLYCAFILFMTLVREPRSNRVFRPELFYEIKALLTGDEKGLYYTALFFENILLFIPFGFLFPWKKSFLQVSLIALSTSVLIEAVQYITVLGECEIDDVITNTFGAIIGFLLFKWVTKRKDNT